MFKLSFQKQSMKFLLSRFPSECHRDAEESKNTKLLVNREHWLDVWCPIFCPWEYSFQDLRRNGRAEEKKPIILFISKPVNDSQTVPTCFGPSIVMKTNFIFATSIFGLFGYVTAKE